MPFIEDEDRAVKALFDGITIPGDGGEARDVNVRWRYPDTEPKDHVFPFISVSMVSAQRAAEREHRGVIPFERLEYLPDGYTQPEDGFGGESQYPIPMNLYYEVAVNARRAKDGTRVLAHLIKNSLQSSRFGYAYVDSDMTRRRLTVEGDFPVRQVIDPFNKRLYRGSVLLSITSEIWPTQEFVRRVESIDLDLTTLGPGRVTA